ncbi:hypothetical protein BGZ54_008893 [Gamsiella multidivaricata]|nr:hypothetical protein BGZ54_008893 [Gamsiella multidivaricata]
MGNKQDRAIQTDNHLPSPSNSPNLTDEAQNSHNGAQHRGVCRVQRKKAPKLDAAATDLETFLDDFEEYADQRQWSRRMWPSKVAEYVDEAVVTYFWTAAFNAKNWSDMRSLIDEYLGNKKVPNVIERAEQQFDKLRREGFNPDRIDGDVAVLEYCL